MHRAFERLVVIMGCPRSGTTWLHGMLCEHPEVAGLGESYLFTDYVAALYRAYRLRWRPYVGLDKALDEDGFRESVRLFADEALSRAAESRPGTRLVVEKTPANALVWREIRELFPEALLVHMLRDPRDVVASLRDAGRSWGRSWAPSGTAAAARMWRQLVESASEADGDPNGIVVRYESLLADTPAELARVAAAAGLKTEPAWCSEVASSHQFARRAREEGSGPSRFLRKGEAGAWRGRREVRVVEYVAGDLMERLGYERSFAPGTGKPLGLAAHDLLRQAGPALYRNGRLLVRRSMGLPDA